MASRRRYCGRREAANDGWPLVRAGQKVVRAALLGSCWRRTLLLRLRVVASCVVAEQSGVACRCLRATGRGRVLLRPASRAGLGDGPLADIALRGGKWYSDPPSRQRV